MDKKQALEILIQHTLIFNDKEKEKLLTNIDALSDQDIYNLGRFLALEKKSAIENNKEMVFDLEQFLKKLENYSN